MVTVSDTIWWILCFIAIIWAISLIFRLDPFGLRNFIRCKIIDNNSFELNGLVFPYKGNTISIKIKHEYIYSNEYKQFPGLLNQDIYYVNGKPAACMYRFHRGLHISREIEFNKDYDTSDFYDIIKAARKHLNRKAGAKELVKEKLY